MTTTTADPVNGGGIKLGDVNNDGLINAVDASLILSEYASVSAGRKSKLKGEQATAADVSENGIIDAVDASLVLKYYVYLSSGGKTADMREWIKNH